MSLLASCMRKRKQCKGRNNTNAIYKYIYTLIVMNDLYNLFFITIQMFIPFLISVALPPLQENDLKSTYYTLYHHQWCDKKVFLFLESQK